MSTDTTPRDPRTGYTFATFLVTLGITTIVVVLAVVWAGRYHDRSQETARLARAAERRDACAEIGRLFVPRIEDGLPMTDPHDERWSAAQRQEIPLQPQTVTAPMLEVATIETVSLQGLTDGQSIVWRLSWKDATNDGNVDSGRFTDAVALQFPMVRNANFTMGDRGQLVQILHWKALWQKDIDEHFQDVQDLHPNYWADLYWFAEGRPYEVPASFQDPRSHAWFAAYSAGNPMSQFQRAVPVEELAAEGYGTLTSHPESVSVGRGVWQDGEWAVVLARPLQSSDELDYQFWSGGRGELGVAVWDGGTGNVGGRKHWSNWTEFEVSP